jgi:capsular exopolysaccharide synthesis family protein
VKKDKDTPGMTQYLSGKVADLAEMINKGEIMDNLDVIHAGPVPPNPAELLLSPRLDTLVKALREAYDYVFIDSVPSGILADAAITNRVADLTIYVVRAGLTDRRQLPEVEKLYRQEKFTNMSVLLNAVNYNAAGYYYYGYGYGYGYY